jgi:hypothetical protein
VNREYAEHFGDSWVILSAKYGFLNPEDIIEGPYDVTFKRRSPPPIGEAALREQVRSRRLDRFDNIIGLGGRDYRIVVQAAFADSNVRLHFPFAGMSLGKSLQAAKRAVLIDQPLPTSASSLSSNSRKV